MTITEKSLRAVALAITSTIANDNSQYEWAFDSGKLPQVKEVMIKWATLVIEAYHQSLWQPIETAPRNGTAIIVYRPDWRKSMFPEVSEDFWCNYDDEAPTWANSSPLSPPTLWQPLPTPPTEKENA